MAKYVNYDKLSSAINNIPCSKQETWYSFYQNVCQCLADALTADVLEVIEADEYKHLICPHCLSEFYAKTKPEMFCPDCGKKFFFSEKWGDDPYVGENIEQGNGLP